jgi:hypothetical protein
MEFCTTFSLLLLIRWNLSDKHSGRNLFESPKSFEIERRTEGNLELSMQQ